MTELIIRRLQEGGFLVGPAYRADGYMSPPPLFACTTIEEALKYVKRKLAEEAK